MVEDGKLRVDKFNGQNYQLWMMHMKYYLYKKDIYILLGGKEKQLMSMKDEEWEVLDKNALGMIWLCLETSVAFNISKENTMEDLMEAFLNLYEKPSTSNKVL
jgi:hypothetical protein